MGYPRNSSAVCLAVTLYVYFYGRLLFSVFLECAMWLLVHNIHVDTAVRRGLLIILTHILHVCFFPRTAPIYACFARVLSSAAFLPRSALILLAALGGSIAGREFALLLWQRVCYHTHNISIPKKFYTPVLFACTTRLPNNMGQNMNTNHEQQVFAVSSC